MFETLKLAPRFDPKTVAFALGPIANRRFANALPLFNKIEHGLLTCGMVKPIPLVPFPHLRMKDIRRELNRIDREIERIDFSLFLLDDPANLVPVTICHYKNLKRAQAMQNALIATPSESGYSLFAPNSQPIIAETPLHLLTGRVPAIALKINFSDNSPATFIFSETGIQLFARLAMDGVFRAAHVYQ